MLEKRFSLTLDFRVTMREITREMVTEHYARRVNFDELLADPDTWADAQRQERLRLALLRDAQALDRFLAYLVAGETEPDIHGQLMHVFAVAGEDEQVLRPVVATLAAENRQYFEAALRDGVFFAATELLHASFVVAWVRAYVTEVRLVAEGDVAAVTAVKTPLPRRRQADS
jgi:hypothetical protein